MLSHIKDMFGNLLAQLTQPKPAAFSEGDARLALAALLVRVARSDEDYSHSETVRIDKILRQRYGLSPFEATQLRSDAERLESEAPDTIRFTTAIKEAVPFDDRMAVVVALWQVVLADGERDPEEDALLRMVSSFLGLSDMDSARARQAAESA